MKCCEKCFSDSFISKQIKDAGEQISECLFCGAKDVFAINPTCLAEYVDPVLDVYVESSESSSKPLWENLKTDWLLFEDLNGDKSAQLIDSIYSDPGFGNLRCISSVSASQTKISSWESFKEELKHENRFFPKKSPSRDHLGRLFPFLISKMASGAFSRARINRDATPFSLSEMGKPPKGLSGNGRANPIGISYLYTASDKETAISEIRPHVGDHVTVAKFELAKEVTLVNLRNPRKTVSPFAIEEEDIPKLLHDLEYLCQLGVELSKPIIPRDAHLEYLPSQYLCELIRDLNYDGVIYKSAVGTGDNYAFFEEDKLKAVEVEVCKVSSVDYSSEPLGA
jgi:hypothetical protein